MIGIRADRCRRPFLLAGFVFASLTASALLTASASAAMEDPIAYIGHGAMFDKDGNEIKPTAAFIGEAQAYYIQFLYDQADRQQRAEYDKLKGELVEGAGLDEQSQLVANAHLIAWLINAVRPEGAERMMGKNNLMMMWMRWKLPEAKQERASTELFEVPPALTERLAATGLLKR